MTTEDVLEHLPLVLYLAAVLLLSIHLFPLHARSASSVLFVILALWALATTWNYMIRFMFSSYQDGRASRPEGSEERLAYTTTVWLKETSLFKQAWEFVCATPERWWISSQLCTFTGGLWTAFLFVEASRKPMLRKKAWQYMLLGQIVAISFASSLFLATLRATPFEGGRQLRTQSRTMANEATSTKEDDEAVAAAPAAAATTTTERTVLLLYSRPTLLLVLSVGVAFGTTYYVPETIGKPSFLLNLLGMHAILFLPLWQVAYSTASSGSKRGNSSSSRGVARSSGSNFSHLYIAIAIASLLIHAKNTLPLLTPSSSSSSSSGTTAMTLEEFAERIGQAWNSYPSQQSISWDVAFTNGIWQVWSLMEFIRLVPFRRHRHVNSHQTLQRPQEESAGEHQEEEEEEDYSGAGLLRNSIESLVALVAIFTVPTLGSAVGISVFLAIREKWLQAADERPRALKTE